SGRNGGQLIDGFVEVEKIASRLDEGAAELAYRMGLECRDLVVERIERYAIDCDLKFGFVDVALNQRDIDYLRQELDRKIRLNYPHRMEFVPKEKIASVVGSERYIGGLVNYGNGHLHPLNLCVGQACAAAD